MGANRHQDFAYVGNALPNSQQWDACDELGLFIIVATPGWQYWNKDKGWDEKVHQNTRSIIRRDRSMPTTT